MLGLDTSPVLKAESKSQSVAPFLRSTVLRSFKVYFIVRPVQYAVPSIAGSSHARRQMTEKKSWNSVALAWRP